MPQQISMFPVGGHSPIDAGFVLTSRDQGLVKVVLSIASIVQENSVFQFTIPSSVGIQLPYSGVALCPSGPRTVCPITVSTNASSGPASKFAVLESGGIGQFRDPVTLRFEPRKAGGGTNLNLSFTPEMDISESEIVRLILPGGFTGVDF